MCLLCRKKLILKVLSLLEYKFCFMTGFLLGLLFYPEDGDVMFLRTPFYLKRYTSLNISEDSTLLNHSYENLKSNINF
jgi:hypothetical protein